MSLNFVDAEIPAEQGRAKEPNPFDGIFPRDEKAVVLEMPGQNDDKDENGAAIRRLCKQARDAAIAVERSARVRQQVKQVKGKDVTVLTFWTVPPIKRTRKDKSENAETPAE